MDNESQAFDIFDQAADIESPEARKAFLDNACGADISLRVRVEALLEADKASGSRFLSKPAVYSVAPEVLLPPGGWIGPYRIRARIGEGGMGDVYLAEQESPVKRRVALKLIKPGMGTSKTIARFEAERQTLALMDHPGIARVFDAGTTASGLPYFVMEFVNGTPITKFCEDEKLDLAQRLNLFAQVCRAVHHAHQKGIIHRDLKPSNILVGVIDGHPAPKIIDFGIAKAVAPDSEGAKPGTTLFERVIGTPAYMSPEQAGAGTDIDIRSDIYSLGIVLYEMLAGAVPFDSTKLMNTGYDEMRRIIREVDPPRPSTRLRERLREVPTADLSFLNALRGDLDWVVMKALEKDRSRRYDSAAAFEDDIQRFLQSRAVLARPPTRSYLARRWVQRNRAFFVASAAVVLTLLGAVAVNNWQAQVARQSLLEAERANRLLLEIFENVNFKSVGREFTSSGLLESLNARADAFEGDPRYKAQILATLGSGCWGMGKPEEGEALYLRAITQWKTSGSSDEDFKHRCNLGLANCLMDNGKGVEALPLFDEVVQYYTRKAGAGALATLRAMNQAGACLRIAGRIKEAVAMSETVARAADGGAGFEPGEIFQIHRNLILAHVQAGSTAEAVALALQNVHYVESVMGKNDAHLFEAWADVVQAHTRAGNPLEAFRAEVKADNFSRAESKFNERYTLGGLIKTSMDLDMLSRYEESLLLGEHALRLCRNQLGENHYETVFMTYRLAIMYRYHKREDEALALCENSLQHLRAVKPHMPGFSSWMLDYLYNEHIRRKDIAGGVECLREILEVRQSFKSEDQVYSLYQSQLGGWLVELKRYTEAEQTLLNSYQTITQRTNISGEHATAKNNAARLLVQVYEATGQPAKAAEWRMKVKQ